MSIKGILTVAAASAALATAGAAFAGEPTPTDAQNDAPAQALSTPVDQPSAEDAATTPAPANVVTTVQTPTLRVEMVSSSPVPDTPSNRRAYGQPESNAGKRTAASGN